MEASGTKFPASPLHADSGATPAALACEVIRAFTEQRWDELPGMVHADAAIETGWGVPGARFGKQAALDGSWVATSTGAYRPEYHFVETLDEKTALVGATLRYQIGVDAVTERNAAYLMIFDEGLLREMCVFDCVDDAVSAHLERQSACLRDRHQPEVRTE